MTVTIDPPALTLVRDYLDQTMYALADRRLALELPPSLTGYPDFDALERIAGRLSPVQQAPFRLFRLGTALDDAAFRAAFPGKVISALLAAGLVAQHPDGTWQTPELLIIPAEGLLLITGLPPSYPAARRPSRAWFDLSTSIVAAALPASLSGARVLDACSGTGVQALLCAVRGASAVTGLEISESAVAVARANAVLNGMQDRVSFRQSDVLSALDAEERFDFVVCNLPYAPVIAGPTCPATVAGIGNSVLWPLLDELPGHLSGRASGIVATWRSAGYQGLTYQLEAIAARLAAAGCDTTAYVDPAFDSVAGVVRLLRKDLEERPAIAAETAEAVAKEVERLVETSELPMDGFYNQIVRFAWSAAGQPNPKPAVYGMASPAGAG